MSESIWGVDQNGTPVHIKVLGVTGKHQAGKTLFVMSIAPGANEETGKPRTKLYDFELSAASYHGLGAEIVDVPGVMRQNFGQHEYTAIDTFRWWQQDVLAIQPGQYDVIGVDPITDIESGLVDFVASQYKQYGFSSKDKFMATGGIFWSRVKEYWKRLLADLASRCHTFAFTSHLRKDWIHGRPTTKDKPGGKITLMELASLYLWLEREPDEQGRVPAVPRCKLKLKDRVDYTTVENGEPVIRPYLPPAFDNCTPKTIRNYIAKPADYKKLRVNERVRRESLSEEDRLDIERQIAEAKAAAEQAALERLQRQKELQEMAAKQQEQVPPSPDQSQQIAAEHDKVAAEHEKAEAETGTQPEASTTPHVSGGEPLDNGKCTPDQAAQLVVLKQKLGIDMARWEAGIAKRTGGSTNVLDLSAEDADDLIAKLGEKVVQLGK